MSKSEIERSLKYNIFVSFEHFKSLENKNPTESLMAKDSIFLVLVHSERVIV